MPADPLNRDETQDLCACGHPRSQHRVVEPLCCLHNAPGLPGDGGPYCKCLAFNGPVGRLTRSDIDRIARLHAESTPGPWTVDSGHGNEITRCGEHEINCENTAPLEERGTADAAFIAAAHQDVPRLLAEINILRTALEKIARSEFVLAGPTCSIMMGESCVKIAREALGESR